HPLAPPELRRVFGDWLADRHRHFAQRPHLSEVSLIMSERNFSRRRRGGMRFRPSGGFNQNQRPDRSATEARAEATGEKKPDAVFERTRHDEEIARAENIAAGLPPEGEPRPEAEGAREPDPRPKRGAFRRPNLETPEEVTE